MLSLAEVCPHAQNRHKCATYIPTKNLEEKSIKKMNWRLTANTMPKVKNTFFMSPKTPEMAPLLNYCHLPRIGQKYIPRVLKVRDLS